MVDKNEIIFMNMNDTPRHIDIIEILNSSPSVTLLRMKAYNMIIGFLTNVFNETMAVSHENIHSRLADFLSDYEVEIDEESDILFSDTYEEKAIKYIKKWTDSGLVFVKPTKETFGEIRIEMNNDKSFVICPAPASYDGYIYVWSEDCQNIIRELK